MMSRTGTFLRTGLPPHKLGHLSSSSNPTHKNMCVTTKTVTTSKWESKKLTAMAAVESGSKPVLCNHQLDQCTDCRKRTI
jgi:hypothetical protein